MTTEVGKEHHKYVLQLYVVVERVTQQNWIRRTGSRRTYHPFFGQNTHRISGSGHLSTYLYLANGCY